MTQQNAALVEESAAASESLREQASGLLRAASQFKLRGGAGMGHASVAPVAAPAPPSTRPAPLARAKGALRLK